MPYFCSNGILASAFGYMICSALQFKLNRNYTASHTLNSCGSYQKSKTSKSVLWFRVICNAFSRRFKPVLRSRVICNAFSFRAWRLVMTTYRTLPLVCRISLRLQPLVFHHTAVNANVSYESFPTSWQQPSQRTAFQVRAW